MIVTLTNKIGVFDIILDDEDKELFRSYKWYVIKNRKNYYVRANNGGYGQGTIDLHHLIMCKREGEIIDHVNGNGLDNRKINLRKCTHAQNSRNRRKPEKNYENTYKGVEKVSDSSWRARITFEGKRHMLGLYDSEEAAAKAYDESAVKLHGEFARLNFPKENK